MRSWWTRSSAPTSDQDDEAASPAASLSIDRGRIVQQGTASSLATTPGSAFVANFTGAVVFTGIARAAPDGLTIVALDGGGEVSATASGPSTGPVAVSVYPWEIVSGVSGLLRARRRDPRSRGITRRGAITPNGWLPDALHGGTATQRIRVAALTSTHQGPANGSPPRQRTIEKTHPTGNRSRPADRETLDPPQGKGQEKDVERKSAL